MIAWHELLSSRKRQARVDSVFGDGRRDLPNSNEETHSYSAKQEQTEMTDSHIQGVGETVSVNAPEPQLPEETLLSPARLEPSIYFSIASDAIFCLFLILLFCQTSHFS